MSAAGNETLNFAGRFELHMKRKPTAEEVNELYEIGHKLGIHPSDALWDVLLISRRERELTVQGIAEAARLREAEEAALQKRIEDAAVKNATAKLESAAPAVAQKAVTTRFLKWLTGAVVVVVLAFVGVAWFAYHQGIEQGRSESNAAASWAGTPSGRLAYKLWQAGSLEHLANCDQPGWKIEKGACHPYEGPNGLWGWALPK